MPDADSTSEDHDHRRAKIIVHPILGRRVFEIDAEVIKNACRQIKIIGIDVLHADIGGWRPGALVILVTWHHLRVCAYRGAMFEPSRVHSMHLQLTSTQPPPWLFSSRIENRSRPCRTFRNREWGTTWRYDEVRNLVYALYNISFWPFASVDQSTHCQRRQARRSAASPARFQ